MLVIWDAMVLIMPSLLWNVVWYVKRYPNLTTMYEHCTYQQRYVLHIEVHVYSWAIICCIMMTSSNGKIFRVTGHLYGEFTGHRWIPRTKPSDMELWYFLSSAPV